VQSYSEIRRSGRRSRSGGRSFERGHATDADAAAPQDDDEEGCGMWVIALMVMAEIDWYASTAVFGASLSFGAIGHLPFIRSD
jgi:hypothetical protein